MAMELDATGVSSNMAQSGDQRDLLIAEANATVPAGAAPQTTTVGLEAGNVVHLPVGTDISHPVQVGNDLEFIQPDGSIILIPNGAVAGLVIFIGDVEIPPDAVAALFSANNIQPAEGPDGGAEGGSPDFHDPGPGGIGDAFGLTDLLPGSELNRETPTINDLDGGNVRPSFPGGAVSASISEEGLGTGNPDSDGTSDTTNSAVITGYLGGVDSDQLVYSLVPATALRSGGYDVTWSGSGTNVLIGSANGSPVISVSVDNSSGQYTVTLLGPIDHPIANAEDVLQLVFNVTATDPSSATGTTTLTISIEDDSPVVSLTQGSFSVDEDALATIYSTGNGNDGLHGTASVTGDLNIRWGADNEDGGADTTTASGAFVQDGALATALTGRSLTFSATSPLLYSASETYNGTLRSHGDLVTVQLSQNGTKLEGVVLGEGNAVIRTVFEVTLSDEGSSGGRFNFQLFDQLDHASGNGENDLNLTFNIVATDFDKDSATGSFTVTVNDDTPILLSEASVSITVAENDINVAGQSVGTSPGDGDTIDHSFTGTPGVDGAGPANATSASGSLLSLLAKSGADDSLTFGFVSDAAVRSALEGQNLKSDGSPLSYQVVGNTLYGFVNTGEANVYGAGDRLVFTLEITNSATGQYKFSLYDQLDHADGAGANNLPIQFGSTLQAVDYDGDAVVLAGRVTVNVTDDVPLVSGTSSITVAENDIDTDSSLGTSPEDGNLLDHSFTGPSNQEVRGPANASAYLTSVVTPGADEPLTFSFVSDAEARSYLTALHLRSHGSELSYQLQGNTLIGFVNAVGLGTTYDVGVDREVFTLTLDDASSGKYTFALYDQLDHATGNGANDKAFDVGGVFKATDYDKDSVLLTGKVTIHVTDDVPQLNNTSAVVLKVDEDDIRTGSSLGTSPNDGNGVDGSYTGPSSDNGPGPANATSTAQSMLGLVVNPGADEGLTFGFIDETALRTFMVGQGLKSHGEVLSYDLQGNTLYGFVNAGGPGTTYDVGTDREVFTLEVNPTTGAFTFSLYDQLDHPLGNGENSLSIEFGAILKATDFDGDSVVLTGKVHVDVTDDVPVAALTLSTSDPYLTVDETVAGTQGDEPGSASLFSAVANHGSYSGMPAQYATDSDLFVTSATKIGADEPAKSAVFALDLTSSPAGGLDSGLKTSREGNEIYLFKETVNGVTYIVGRYDGPDGGDTVSSGDPAAFALRVNPSTGALSVALFVPIVNPTAGNNNEAAYLGENLVKVSYTVTDYDGDSSTATLDLHDIVRFLDDGPTVITSTTGHVDEDDLPSGNHDLATGDDLANPSPVSVSGSFGINFGADGPAASGAISGVTIQSGLTWDGHAIGTALVQVGNEWFARTTDSSHHDVFKVSFNTSTGQYTFTLLDNIDHPSHGTEDNRSINFSFTATDADLDTATGSFSVDVDDDMPTIGTPTAGRVVEEEEWIVDGPGNEDGSGSGDADHTDGIFPFVHNDTTQLASGSLAINWGADNGNRGTGGNGDRSVAFANVIAPIGLTSRGDAVHYGVLTVAGQPTLVAYTGSVVGTNGELSLTQAASVHAVFTVSLDDLDHGHYNFVLYDVLDQSQQGEDTLPLTFSYTATDSDGDTSAAQTFTVGVIDDTPISKGGIADRAVEEESLPSGNDDSKSVGGVDRDTDTDLGRTTTSASNSLNIAWGGDDSNKNVNGGFNGAQVMGDRSVVFAGSSGAYLADGMELTSSQVEAFLSVSGGVTLATLKSGGEALNYVLSNNGTVLTASTATSHHTVFTVTLSDKDDGSYAFELKGPLDHPTVGTSPNDEESLGLKFTFTARDSDGDRLVDSFTVKVVDDSPLAGGATLSGSDQIFVGADNAYVPAADNSYPLIVNGNTTSAPLAGADGWYGGSFGTAVSFGTPPAISVVNPQTGQTLVINWATTPVHDATSATLLGYIAGSATPVVGLTISADGKVTFSSGLPIAHGVGSDSATFNFGYSLRDGDGDSTGSKTIAVTIADGKPVAAVPASLAVDEGVIVGANHHYDAPGPHVDDTIIQYTSAVPATPPTSGPDGWRGGSFATAVTFTGPFPVVSIIDPTDGTSHAVTFSQFAGSGTIGGFATIGGVSVGVVSFTVNENGTFTYVQVYPLDNSSSDLSKTLNFTYTLSDADGDTTAVQTIPVTVTDATPLIGDGTASTDESGFNSASTISASGTVVVQFGSDNGKIAFDATQPGLANLHTADGQAITNFVMTASGIGAGAATLVAYDASAHEAFRLTLNADGSYTYKQSEPLQHPSSGADSLPLTFAYSLKDSDGDSDPGKITITVGDDVPSVNPTQTPIVVDEEGLSGGNAGDSYSTGDAAGEVVSITNGKLLYSFGADGPATSATDIVFSTSGLPAYTSGGVALSYSWDNSTNTLTASAGANTVFALHVTDVTTGAYTFTLSRPLDHATANVEDDRSFTLNFTITDRDGDSKSGSVSLTVNDDAPIITQVADGRVDEDALTNGVAGGPGDQDGGKTAHGNLQVHYGADGPAAAVVSSTTSTLKFDTLQHGSSGPFTISGVTFSPSGQGGASNYLGSDGQIFGHSITVTDAAGPFVLNSLSLAVNGAGPAQAVLTGIDTFGHTITTTINVPSVVLGPSLTQNFVLGAPFAGVALTSLVITPAAGNAGNVIIDNFNVSTDAHLTDGPVTFTNHSNAAANVSITDGNGQVVNLADLKSNGSAVHFALVDAVTLVAYTGSTPPTTTGAANVVFSVVLSSGGTGAYDFTLNAPLDHPITGTEDDLNFTFKYTAKDFDGDTKDSSFRVLVNDDSPKATDEGTLATTAEHSTGVDLGLVSTIFANAKYGADGPATSGAITVATGTSGGTVTFGNDGHLYYSNTSANVTNGQTLLDSFTYTLKDRDGDTSQATFTVTLTDTGVGAVTASTNLLADEDDLAAGNHDHATGDDDPVTSGHIAYTLGADHIGSVVLSSGATGLKTLAGDDVDTTWSGGKLIGYIHGTDASVTANQIFTIAVTNVTDTGADYTMTLLQPVKHAGTNPGVEDNTTPFTVTATVTDSDGSTGTTQFSVSIDDDVPTVSIGVPGLANGLDFGAFDPNGNAWGQGSGTATGQNGGWTIATSGTNHDGSGTVQLERVGDGYLGMHSSTHGYMVDLDASARDVKISQAIGGLTEGQVFDLRFEAGAPYPSSAHLEVYFGSVKVFDSDTDGPLTTTMTGHTLHLVAGAAGNNTLEFRETGVADNQGTYLANISVGGIVIDETAGQQGDSSEVAANTLFDAIAHPGHDDDMVPQFAAGSGPVVSVSAKFGADGPQGGSAADATSYHLATSDMHDSGLSTTTGRPILLFNEIHGGVDFVVGRYDSNGLDGVTADDDAAFAFRIDPSTGVVSMVQYVSLHHGVTTNADDPAYLSAGSLNVTVTIVDGDGDSVTSAPADISAQIRFDDDGPTATALQASLPTIVLDESPVGTDPNGDNDPKGVHSMTASFAASFAAPNYGADGAGSTGGTSYGLVLAGAGLASGLYALGGGGVRGDEILLTQTGNVITGAVGATSYFTITVDAANGQVTFTQLANVWHDNAANSDDTATLTLAANALRLTQTVVDGDGDSATAAVDLGQGVFQIEDDGPTVGAPTRDLGPNLIVNGGFEQPADVPGGWQVYAAIPGWTALDGIPIEVQQGGAGGLAPQDGSANLVELDTDTFGNGSVDQNASDQTNVTIQQTIATEIGQTYVLSFWYAPRPDHADSSGMVVKFGSLSIEFPTGGEPGWHHYTATVTADSVSTVLSFTGTGTPDEFGMLLDNVSLQSTVQTLDDEAQLGGAEGGPGDVAGAVGHASGKLAFDPGTDGLQSVSFAESLSVTNSNAASNGGLQVLYVDSNGVPHIETVHLEWVANGKGGTLHGVTEAGGHYSSTATPAFVLTVAEDGTYAFDLKAPLYHPFNTAAGSVAAGSAWEDELTLNFTYTVKDGDNDTATGTLSFKVDDDSPVAVGDTATAVEGATLTVDAEHGVLANDHFGADGGTIIGVRSAGTDTTTSVTGGIGTPLTGAYGVLTLHADGSYDYVANGNLANAAGLSDTFVYTIQDGDGDASTTTLTINVADGTAAPDASAITLEVDEAALYTSGAHGTNPSLTTETDSSPALSFTAGSDDLVSFAFSNDLSGLVTDLNSDGTQDIFWAPATGTQIKGYLDSAHSKLAVTLDLTSPGTIAHGSSGDVTVKVTLSDNLMHATGNAAQVSSIGHVQVLATDIDGDVSHGQVNIDVKDDVPVITGTVTPGSIVEGNLPYAQQTFPTSLKINFGADGANASVNFLTTVKDVDGNTLTLKSGGQTLDLYVDTDSSGYKMLVAVVNGAQHLPDNAVFTVSLINFSSATNPDYGYIFTQFGPLDHLGAYDSNLPLVFTATGYDGDGDPVDQSFTVNVADATPQASPDVGTVTEGTTLTVDAAGGVLANDNGGADGLAGITGVRAGSDTTTATVDAGSINTQVAGLYGKLTLHADGSYEYAANSNLSNATALTDTFVYTIKDGDGDLSTTTLTISINDGMGPSVSSGAVTLNLKESDLDGNKDGSDLAAGHVQGSAGGVAANTGETATSGTGNALMFTAHSDAISSIAFANPAGSTFVAPTITGIEAGTVVAWSYDPADSAGHTLLGKIGGTTVIILALSGQLAAASGATATPTITATLTDAFPHEDSPNATTLQISGISVVATDTDGTAVSGYVTVNVADDVPVAHADTPLVVNETAASTAGVNLLANDVKGADGASVTHVNFGNGWQVVSGSPFTVAGIGTFSVAADGTWSLTPVVNASSSDQAFSFSYRITDGDGDVSEANQQVTVKNVGGPSDGGLAGKFYAFTDDTMASHSQPTTIYFDAHELFPALTTPTFTFKVLSGDASWLSMNTSTGTVTSLDQNGADPGIGPSTRHETAIVRVDVTDNNGVVSSSYVAFTALDGGVYTQSGAGPDYEINKTTLFVGTTPPSSNFPHGDVFVASDAGGSYVLDKGGAVYGGPGADTLDLRTAQHSYIDGGAGADIIYGSNQDDVLIGGAGHDTLTGGDGADIFVWGSEAVSTDNTDTITDFNYNSGADRLDLSSIFTHDIASGQLSNYLRVVSHDGYTSVKVSPNGDGQFVEIYKLLPSSSSVHVNAGDTINILFGQTNHAVTVVSGSDPLILDLDGDGVHFNSVASFDLDGEGATSKVAWPGARDGMLVADLDHSGSIENGREVFSPSFGGGGYATSLEALRTYDSNGDGKITADDAHFADIGVWTDTNGDGVSDAGELHSLTDLGIVGIDLGAEEVDFDLGGPHAFAKGTFELASGETHNFFGVDLGMSDADPLAVPPQVTGAVHSGTDGADTFALTNLNAVDFIADYDFGQGDTVDLSALLGTHSGATAENAADYVKVVGNTVSVDVDGAGTAHDFVDVAVLNQPVPDVKVILDDGVDVTINHLG